MGRGAESKFGRKEQRSQFVIYSLRTVKLIMLVEKPLKIEVKLYHGRKMLTFLIWVININLYCTQEDQNASLISNKKKASILICKLSF